MVLGWNYPFFLSIKLVRGFGQRPRPSLYNRVGTCFRWEMAVAGARRRHKFIAASPPKWLRNGRFHVLTLTLPCGGHSYKNKNYRLAPVPGGPKCEVLKNTRWGFWI